MQVSPGCPHEALLGLDRRAMEVISSYCFCGCHYVLRYGSLEIGLGV